MKIAQIVTEDWVSWLTKTFLNSEKKREEIEQIRQSELNHDEQRRTITQMAQDAATKGGYKVDDSEKLQDIVDRLLSQTSTPVPKTRPDVVQTAINKAAKDLGVSPSALRAIVKTESNFKSTAVSPSGNHYGATQIHKSHFPMAGMTAEEFRAASLDEQIAVYPEWAKSYRMSEKFPNIGTYKPAVQAAIMQAFQFAPNGTRWQNAFHAGNFDVPVTKSQQAGKLGTTSIRDMYAYFVGLGL